MKKIENILVINFGGIGDEILFLPTLISLKKTYPNAKITLALESRSKGIKDLTDIINELIFVDIKGKNKYSELLKLVFKARKGNFDLVISSGGNKLISILLFLMGIKKRYGYYTGKLSEKLLTKAVPLNKNQYAAYMYQDLIASLSDIKTELPEIKLEYSEKLPNSVLIHPGVSKLSVQKGMIKTISPEKWANIINILVEKGKNVILTGGPDDKEVIEEIRNNLQFNPNSILNFQDNYGQTKNLMELAELISKAEKFICSDSAPLHIAVALKVKTYVIFGPTDDKTLIPDSNDIIAIKTKDNCPVKPCLWKHRQTTCPELSCLNISVDSIISTVLN